MLLSCFNFLVFFFSNNRCIFYLTNNNGPFDTDTFYCPSRSRHKGRLTVLLLRFFMSFFGQISGRCWNRHADWPGNGHVWCNYVRKSNICVIK